jgi:hypothetical protein
MPRPDVAKPQGRIARRRFARLDAAKARVRGFLRLEPRAEENVDCCKTMEDRMGSVLKCPETGEPVRFHVKADAKSVWHAWNQFIHVTCPHCGGRHDVQYQEVYMDGELTGFQDDFALILLEKRQRPRFNAEKNAPY